MSPDLYILQLSDEEYKKATLQMRLVTDMIAHKAEEKFHVACSHIISDRCHKKYGFKDWDENERLSIREHNKEFEAQIMCYSALERVYESVYGSIKPYEEKINEIATEYSNIMLKKYGWIKETEQKENANER